PRQDSNLRSRLRRAVLYPLSYGGSWTQTRVAGWPARTASALGVMPEALVIADTARRSRRLASLLARMSYPYLGGIPCPCRVQCSARLLMPASGRSCSVYSYSSEHPPSPTPHRRPRPRVLPCTAGLDRTRGTSPTQVARSTYRWP